MNDNRNKAIVFCAFTADHLINSLYYSTKINWRDNKKVLLWQQFLGQDVKKELFSEYFDEIIAIPKMSDNVFKRQLHRLFYFGRLFSFSNLYKKLKKYDIKVIFYFSDQQYLTLNVLKHFSNWKNITVMLEEGLGTYYLPKSNEHDKKSLIEKFIGIKTCDYIGQTDSANYIFVKYPEFFPNTKVGRAIVIKKNNIYLDDKWIENIHLFHNNLKLTNENKLILWLSGPLVENGISEKEEIDLLDNLSNSFKDYTFLIKLHPAEKASKYSQVIVNGNVKILEMGELFWLPIEILIKSIKPFACFSIISSALGNIVDIDSSIKLVYLYRMMNRSEYDSLIYERYKDKTNVLFPNDLEEIIAFFEAHNENLYSEDYVIENKDIEFLTKNLV